MRPPRRPYTLITNDDGINAEGLWQLAGAAAAAGLDVLVAAPAHEASGSSAAMSAVGPNGRIAVQRRELPAPAAGIEAYAVSGSPARIVALAVRGAFGPPPRLVLSGINHGPNTGRAILHSGTVGAALTAALHGVPAAAFSQAADYPRHWGTAAAVAAEVLAALPDLPGTEILNVNIPDIDTERFTGIRTARLAAFGAIQMTVAGLDDGFAHVTMVIPDGEPEPGTDVAVLAAGQASVTRLHGIREAPATGLPWPAATGPALHR